MMITFKDAKRPTKRLGLFALIGLGMVVLVLAYVTEGFTKFPTSWEQWRLGFWVSEQEAKL